MITPAISVLSAVEGLEMRHAVLQAVRHPADHHHPHPSLLFSKARHDRRRLRLRTDHAGLVFHAGIDGIRGILWQPRCSSPINPMYAVRFFAANGMHGFLVLGAVFLVTTAVKRSMPTSALRRETDPGDGSASSVRRWFSIIRPGRVADQQPSAAHNPFYLLAPWPK